MAMHNLYSFVGWAKRSAAQQIMTLLGFDESTQLRLRGYIVRDPATRNRACGVTKKHHCRFKNNTNPAANNKHNVGIAAASNGGN